MSSSRTSQSFAEPAQMTSTSFDATTTTVKFALFPKLPAELRVRIWKLASNETRNVDIWVRNIHVGIWNSPYAGTPTWSPYALYSSTKAPSILHVCHESRVEGLKYYVLDFGSTFKFKNYKTDKRFPNMRVTMPPQIYINWDVDRICIMRPEDFHASSRTHKSPDNKRIAKFLDRCEKMELKYLAVNAAHRRMPNLELCYSDDGMVDSEEDDDSRPPFAALIPWGGFLRELTLFSDDRWTGPSDFDMRSHSVPGNLLLEDVERHTPEWVTPAGAVDSFYSEMEIVASDVDDPDDFFDRVLDPLDVVLCKLKFD
ncbi:hypothetical protein ONS96_014332 [Cadophora gregata f. sp. sojae]|nr:hypothetical protein ONS96_014332 [Cadophora gregata f. sp. sojae]